MREDVHQQARQLIALDGRAEPLSVDQQAWLRVHLQDCEACRQYSEAAGEVIQAVRSQPMEMDVAFMRRLQADLRLHAVEQRRRQERVRLAILFCVFAGVSALLTTFGSWRALEWITVTAHPSSLVWKIAFALFWIVPTLVVSAVLMVRGTPLHDKGEIRWN